LKSPGFEFCRYEHLYIENIVLHFVVPLTIEEMLQTIEKKASLLNCHPKYCA
jgi:hypothetical protein